MDFMELHNTDCLEIMKGMADKSVDLILTDPPYGLGEAAGKNKSRGSAQGANKWKGTRNTTGAGVPAKDYGTLQWDNAPPSAEYFREMLRVSKHQIIFGGNYFVEHLRNSPCWIVWDKDNGETDFADCELAWCSFSSAVRRFKYRWNGMLQQNMGDKEERIHPTQKPVRLFEWILERYAKPGQVIFDPYMGSGSSAIAAQALGLPYIGCEREPTYFEAAKLRIEEAAGQCRFDFARMVS